MLRFLNLISIYVLLLACARQGAIPNPDRFPPHLLNATSVNRTQVNLRFDEELGADALLPNTFFITSPLDTAEIRFITVDPGDRTTYNLLTSPLLDVTYQISALVFDRNDNASLIKASFKASTRQDTTGPSVLAYPDLPQTRFPYAVKFQFSEPVDTGRRIRVLSAPLAMPENLVSKWDPTLTRLTVECSDTFLRGYPFYAVLLAGSRDFAGNRETMGLSVFVYSDTSLELTELRGDIRTSSGGAAYGALLLFLTSDSLLALTQSDTSGLFQVTLHAADQLSVTAYFDPDSDYWFDEKTSVVISSLADTIHLKTQPLLAPIDVDQIFQAFR
ncbi:hypothetical protein JXM67_13915 [candidate division WOR-3 bacterium]|nr:hypothetical protein [candidate division WOR-3 bacterium]